ncbi:ribosome recycling factor [Candidatus Gracilibacteria bacterium]|nr:ribosome recycling factor [Candidatus Gracilibacteria bacterium]
MSEQLMQNADAEFKRVLEHLASEYSHLQIGRASAALVEHLQVEAYGTKQPLKGLAGISIPDAKTVQIQPWDRGILGDIEKAIRNSDLNLAPTNDGVVVRLNLPPLTEERRRDLSKVVGKMAEESRIDVRRVRQEIIDQLKAKEKSAEISEDQLHTFEKKLQDKVDKVNLDIETMAKNKEKDIMTV